MRSTLPPMLAATFSLEAHNRAMERAIQAERSPSPHRSTPTSSSRTGRAPRLTKA